MTMKLINILKEDDDNVQLLKDMKNEIIERLNGITVFFQYGHIYFNREDTLIQQRLSNTVVIVALNISLNKFEPDMFDKAYLAFAQKIKSLFGDKFNLEYVTLRFEHIWLSIGSSYIPINNYIPVMTKNTLRYDNPSVEKILKGDYHVGVNMDLLPHINDDTYDIIEKKREHGRSVFEFLEDGTLSNGTSYKLIFQDLGVGHHHKESSGRHLDYSDFYLQLDVKIDKDFPLDREEKKEIKKMFRMYDVELDFIIS